MNKLITVTGPTASGKTQLAVALAEKIGGEIISADSRQVYRGMDLGTGKDLEDYILPDGRQIPYHLIDVCDAGEKYNLFRFLEDFRSVYADIISRGKTPILCGGTGLYVEAVLKDFRLKRVPENKQLRESLKDKSLEELTVILKDLKLRNGSTMHNTTDVDSCKRAIRAIEIELAEINVDKSGNSSLPNNQETLQNHISSINTNNYDNQENPANLVFAVDISRKLRREKITRRLDERLRNGMLEEVQRLLDRGIAPEDLIYYGLEYKFLTLHLIGELSFEEMRRQLEIAIHQFAKRQMTWFRGMQKRGTEIHWIDYNLPMEEKVQRIINECKLA